MVKDLRRGEDQTQELALMEAEYSLKMLEQNKKRAVLERETKVEEAERLKIDLARFDIRMKKIESDIEAKKQEVEVLRKTLEPTE